MSSSLVSFTGTPKLSFSDKVRKHSEKIFFVFCLLVFSLGPVLGGYYTKRME